MHVQRNSFYSSTSVCPSHQGASWSGSTPATDTSSDDEDIDGIDGIDGPKSRKKRLDKIRLDKIRLDKKHHSFHAQNTGDIGDHHGKTHYHSKHPGSPTQSTQNSVLSSFMTKLGTLFGSGSNPFQSPLPQK